MRTSGHAHRSERGGTETAPYGTATMEKLRQGDADVVPKMVKKPKERGGQAVRMPSRV